MFCPTFIFLTSCVFLHHPCFSLFGTSWVVCRTQISKPWRGVLEKHFDQRHHHNRTTVMAAAHATWQEVRLRVAGTDWSTDTNPSPVHFYPAKWEIARTELQLKERDLFCMILWLASPLLCSGFSLPWMVFRRGSEVDCDSKNFCGQKSLKTLTFKSNYSDTGIWSFWFFFLSFLPSKQLLLVFKVLKALNKRDCNWFPSIFKM